MRQMFPCGCGGPVKLFECSLLEVVDECVECGATWEDEEWLRYLAWLVRL
jgi:hypothetical protein